MLYKRRTEIVEAREYDGPPLTLVHEKLGEQKVTKGDWLIGIEKHRVRKMSAADFHEQYEAVTHKVLAKREPAAVA